MSSAAVDEKVQAFQDMVGTTERVGVSEFARSKGWRDKLPAVGCLEVVDRSGVVGYMIAPDYAEALSAKISDLEDQVERTQIAAMFEAREGRVDVASGGSLGKTALSYFDEHSDELLEIVDGD